ncbi:MAG: tripartite tricarboxylate transporter substrate binding protein [Proteobacteria bacterium]|nr:tripartite tricarboxylate transporter substrate binding protein [Pseudomonadota bacterium]
MQFPPLALCRWLAACLFAVALCGPAAAAFPERPIVLVVPYPPGGAADTLARIIAHHLGDQLPGSTWVVENKSGAGTAIGATLVARAKPDGYTLLVSGNTTYTLNPALKSNLQYDPLTSFESLGILGESPLVLVANAKFPANSVQELIAMAKREPGKLNLASFGFGTTSHFAGEMFKAAAGVDIVHIPYNGSAPAMKDLIAGQVPLSFDTNVASVPQVKAGAIKALALTSTYRIDDLPGVPTLAESGFPGFDLTAWISVVAPRGLPEPVRATLVKAMADVMAKPEMKADLQRVGLIVRFQPPSAYDARVKNELETMRAIVKRANMKIQ